MQVGQEFLGILLLKILNKLHNKFSFGRKAFDEIITDISIFMHNICPCWKTNKLISEPPKKGQKLTLAWFIVFRETDKKTILYTDH